MARSLATVPVFAAALSLFVPALGHADPIQACLAASERAQELKNAGKLSGARAQLAICSREDCPKLVQQDCTQLLSEVLQATPTVIPSAKDRRGRDVIAATFAVDGETLTKSLDGRPLSIDPGVHTLRFETAGAPAVEEKVVIRQGEKNRILGVTFALGEDASPDGPKTTPNTPPSGETRPPEGGRGVPVLGIVVGGLGVAAGGVALYLGLSADADARNLRDACAPRCASADVTAVSDRQDFARLLGIGAGVVTVAGVVLVVAHYVSGGSKPQQTSVRPGFSVSPSGAAVFRF